MGLQTENNAQYYSGQQSFAVGAFPRTSFDVTFDTPLVSAYDINGNEVAHYQAGQNPGDFAKWTKLD